MYILLGDAVSSFLNCPRFRSHLVFEALVFRKPVVTHGARLCWVLTSANRFLVEPATRLCIRQILPSAFSGLAGRK